MDIESGKMIVETVNLTDSRNSVFRNSKTSFNREIPVELRSVGIGWCEEEARDVRISSSRSFFQRYPGKKVFRDLLPRLGVRSQGSRITMMDLLITD